MAIKILITGSSGYVGSFLVPLLRKRFSVIAVDRVASRHTDIVKNIADGDLRSDLSTEDAYVVIHCAAARFDHGIEAEIYFDENVEKTRFFVKNIEFIQYYTVHSY